MKRLAAVLAALALAVAGCSSSTHNSAAPATSGGTSGALSGTITVLAASSLTEAFDTLGKQFEAAHPGTTVKFSYDASSTLATQITQGIPADVFASASPTNMTTVVSAGDASSPTVFVTNKGEIATPPGNPKKISAVRDLAKSGVKVALCDEQVPCGKVAAAIFKNAKITVKPVSRDANVKATLAKVEINEADASIVYVTDVKAAGSKVTGVAIPDSLNATTDYPIAPLTHSKNSALAQAFVDFVRSSAGLSVLTAAGFSTP